MSVKGRGILLSINFLKQGRLLNLELAHLLVTKAPGAPDPTTQHWDYQLLLLNGAGV